MCAQYTVKIKADQFSHRFNMKTPKELENFESRILPYQTAPVIVDDKNQLKFTPMKFSLVPSWSSEPKVKFATHNARIESIDLKPTWKTPFLSHHCVVPISSFYESAYEGPLEGHIIKFTQGEEDIMLAAGIFDYWKDPQNEKNNFFSFSILTRDPSEFISKYGHDRTPIFIREKFMNEWLNMKEKDFSVVKTALLENAYHPDLKVESDRPMKAGWEKRK